MKGCYLCEYDIKLAQMLKDEHFCRFKMAGSQVLEVSFIQRILISGTAFSFCRFADFLPFQVQFTHQQCLVTC